MLATPPGGYGTLRARARRGYRHWRFRTSSVLRADKRTMYLAAIGIVRDSIAASADRLDAANPGLREALDL